MNALADWMNSLDAADIMVRDVVTVSPQDNLSKTVTKLLKEQITGAPVTDSSGTCVGVFSATDVLSFEEKRSNCSDASMSPYFRSYEIWERETDQWSQIQSMSSDLEAATVSEFMCSDLVSVEESVPISSVVRLMTDLHVHRVLVTDKSTKLEGIISTLDVLNALHESSLDRVSTP